MIFIEWLFSIIALICAFGLCSVLDLELGAIIESNFSVAEHFQQKITMVLVVTIYLSLIYTFPILKILKAAQNYKLSYYNKIVYYGHRDKVIFTMFKVLFYIIIQVTICISKLKAEFWNFSGFQWTRWEVSLIYTGPSNIVHILAGFVKSDQKT